MDKYGSLAVEHYNTVRPLASPATVDFYEKQLADVDGPILDAMCGSGQLLLPLLERGLTVHGVDNSTSMLESCRRRLASNLSTELYEASVETLSLPYSYGAIFVAIGSFQCIADRQSALATLQNFRRALLPDGKLLLELWTPSETMGEVQSSPQVEVELPGGSAIQMTHSYAIDRDARLITSRFIYRKRCDGVGVSEERQERLRWYDQYEMELLLEAAGLRTVTVHPREEPEVPNSVVYEARP